MCLWVGPSVLTSCCRALGPDRPANHCCCVASGPPAPLSCQASRPAAPCGAQHPPAQSSQVSPCTSRSSSDCLGQGWRQPLPIPRTMAQGSWQLRARLSVNFGVSWAHPHPLTLRMYQGGSIALRPRPAAGFPAPSTLSCRGPVPGPGPSGQLAGCLAQRVPSRGVRCSAVGAFVLFPVPGAR